MNPTDSTIPRLNASGCADPTVYEVLKREQRAQFGYRPLAYICSPFAGDTEANIRLARRMCASYHIISARKKRKCYATSANSKFDDIMPINFSIQEFCKTC